MRDFQSVSEMTGEMRQSKTAVVWLEVRWSTRSSTDVNVTSLVPLGVGGLQNLAYMHMGTLKPREFREVAQRHQHISGE